jgi:hypothetical protein
MRHRRQRYRPKSPKCPYRGVTPEGNHFRASVKIGGQRYWLGSYKVAAEAAWYADFARYMLFGLDTTAWPRPRCRRYHGGRPRQKPNFPPCRTYLGMQNYVLRILFCHGLLDRPTMEARRKEYDAAAARPAPAIS